MVNKELGATSVEDNSSRDISVGEYGGSVWPKSGQAGGDWWRRAGERMENMWGKILRRVRWASLLKRMVGR